MVDINRLRGSIFSKYKTIAACAEAAGISRHIIYNILNGKKLPNSDDITKIGRACGMTADEVKAIFLN